MQSFGRRPEPLDSVRVPPPAIQSRLEEIPPESTRKCDICPMEFAPLPTSQCEWSTHGIQGVAGQCEGLSQDGCNGALHFNMRDEALLPGAEGNKDSHTESMTEFQGS